MGIVFISINDEFNALAKKAGYEVYNMRVEHWVPRRKTYYMSPANSIGFMDGGIDLALSRTVMPGIEPVVKKAVKVFGKPNRINRQYLPIGSSIIIDWDENTSLVVAPTMLLPQDINGTENVYWAVKSCLFNVLKNHGQKLDQVDIILTSAGCGFGKLSGVIAWEQTAKAIGSYNDFKCVQVNSHVVLAEPNLNAQAKIYQNHEFINILD